MDLETPLISPAFFQTVFSRKVTATSVHCKLKLIGIGAFLLSLTSCGGSAGPKLPPKKPCIKIAGQVLVDGKPAEKVEVVLHPTIENHGLFQFPHAVTNANGEFKLGTYASNDGAPAGQYSAVFVWPIPVSEQVDDDDRLRRLYSDPLKSQFKVTIDSAKTKLDPFELKLEGMEWTPLDESDIKKLQFLQKQPKATSSK